MKPVIEDKREKAVRRTIEAALNEITSTEKQSPAGRRKNKNTKRAKKA